MISTIKIFNQVNHVNLRYLRAIWASDRGWWVGFMGLALWGWWVIFLS